MTQTGMYERILVPTDGSEEVERAIEHALDLAETHEATVHAIYVINAATYGSLPMETSWEGINQMFREEGTRALDRVADMAADRDLTIETTLLEGSPSREIVRYLEAEECDLVVMGTHGRGGIDRLLLGSVAERVVRTSSVPVLTVPVGDNTEAGEEPAEETQEEPSDVTQQESVDEESS